MKLDDLGLSVSEIMNGGTLAVITEDHVAPLYLERTVRSLERSGFRTAEFILPSGEATKCGEKYLELLEFCAGIPLTRTDGIVALGGGMTGDIAGFVAATYLRGIKVIQVPTTLLAAVDSSVGGKTAIDLSAGKNLAGAFHKPALVFQDPELLKTLPDDVFRDGMAEVIKSGVIADEDLFDRLGDPGKVREDPEPVILRCVEIKESFVEKDVYDTGIRHILNFGHTVGHAVEKLSDYTISHGKAVAIGMNRMAGFSVDRGFCGERDRDRLREMLEIWGFDLSMPFTRGEIYRAICSDKKREGDDISLVTMEKIGHCVITSYALEDIRNII